MSVIPTNYVNPTGLRNVIVSFQKWLETNVPASDVNGTQFNYYFTPQLRPPKFPAVVVQQFQYFDHGTSAMGNEVFPTGAQTQGKLGQTMLDISIYTDETADKSALQKLWLISDRLVRGLNLAGVSDDVTNTQILPEIAVLDYSKTVPAATGIVAWVPVGEDNHIIHRYYAPTEDALNIHQYQMLVKLCWWELN